MKEKLVEFSKREKRVLEIIGRKRVTLEEISTELFKHGTKPLDSKIAVANSVTRIIKKCSHYDLTWTLEKIRENNKLTIKRKRL